MISALRQIFRAREDRLSMSIVPEQILDTGLRTPCLSWLFDEDLGDHQNSRLVSDKPLEKQDEVKSCSKADAAVMSKVADWLASRDCDEFWAQRDKQPRKVSSSNQCAIFSDQYSRFLLLVSYLRNQSSLILARLLHRVTHPPLTSYSTQSHNNYLRPITLSSLARATTGYQCSSRDGKPRRSRLCVWNHNTNSHRLQATMHVYLPKRVHGWDFTRG
jgi:hypothetical protein